MYLSFPQIQCTPHVHMAITGIGMACFHALQRKTPTSTSIQKMLELLYDKALEQLTPTFYNQGCERVMTAPLFPTECFLQCGQQVLTSRVCIPPCLHAEEEILPLSFRACWKLWKSMYRSKKSANL